MYEYLSGKLIECGAGHAVVEVGGIGFHLLAPSSTCEALADKSHVRVFTSLRVREDRVVLYGFATAAERDAFHLICGVSMVGPGTALAILSSMSLEAFQRAVASGNAKILQQIKGVGKKTAERLVLELKDQIPAAWAAGANGQRAARSQEVDDAVQSLVALEFPLSQAEQAVSEALREVPAGSSAEVLIKAAIKMSRARV